MNAQEMMEKLVRHPMLYSNIGLQMQLGLPYLEKRHGKLCVSFLPHREACENGNILFFAPQYKITWVYPFERVVFFENSLYYDAPDLAQPLGTMPLERYGERGKFLLKDLYAQCTDVLQLYERDKTVSEVTLRRYQKVYFETVQALGLTGLYGEGNQ